MIAFFDRYRTGIISVGIALGVTLGLLVLVDAPPFEALQLLWEGSFGSGAKLTGTLATWVPLVLTASGLLVTFQAGLWNIGAEGQIILGAIGASWMAREMGGPTFVIVVATIIGGAAFGALWALIPAYLRTRFQVHEIFSGVALYFVALSVTVYLIIGPWSRVGIASTGGTDLFDEKAWLPTLFRLNIGTFGSVRISTGLVLALVAVVSVYYLLRGTRYGLRVKAVGQGQPSAFLMGIPTSRYMMSAFLICGALAGLAGAMQATDFQHKLVPGISGNYGFLAVLVVLLAGFRAKWIGPIALFFAAVLVGSTQLSLRLSIDSSLAGVIQGVLVLSILLTGGWQARRLRRLEDAAAAPPETAAVGEA
jgi:simple sugar transport system permease protein